MPTPSPTTLRRTATTACAATLLSASLLGLATTPALAAEVAIVSAGPLTTVGATTDLNCFVSRLGDASPEFYDRTACGTLAVVGGVLYGPASIPAGGDAAPRTAFTPVSQSGVTGSGTDADPYRVVTVVAAGSTGVRLVQTDSYVVGDDSYRTDVRVENTGSADVPVLLYRAGDCYLQNSDLGYGQTYGDTGAIACRAADSNDPSQKGSRVEQWFPLTPGSHYFQAEYDQVWARIGAQLPFDDTCLACDTRVDNGAGLSWQFTVPAGGQVTQSHLLSISPTGVVPLVTTKTAQTATVQAGATDAYTITISNPGSTAVPLTSITDTLPDGFTYRPGTTTGATQADPAVTGQTLTWATSASVPGGGSVSLTFGVDVPCTPGTFTNDAGGNATGVPVAPVQDTAPVTVTGTCGTEQPASTGMSAAPATTQHSDPATLTGTLTSGGAPLAGVPVTISLAGTDSAATTGSDGSAGVALPQVLLAPGTYPYTVAFAGSATHAASSATGTLTVTKEDCTLGYTGDGQVGAGTATTLRAQFGEPDATKGDWSGKATTFTLTGAAGQPVEGATATTGATGSAQASRTLAPDVYAVTAAFAGDSHYTACSSPSADLLVVEDAAAKVTGGGFVTSPGRVSFGFNAKSTPTGPTGQLQLRSGGRDRFHGSTVTSLTVQGSTATWSGAGRWNGVEGATFTVTATDHRSGGPRRGSSADTLSVQVRTASGAVVLTASGELKGGNLTVR